ncbi:DUF3833 domain-containing protein [Pseudoalteromonas rubra]|uniref:DUF3833 domain-containing protein n=1 Tax=Pseudoalteromonas rubra TaxID=43658 RepID=UPI000F77C0A4|nr:DUF3833 domain-containing protein [Pseudoalteromonas rubra]
MKLVITLLLALALSGCTSKTIADYSDTKPELALEQFFEGELTAYGIVLDRSGNLTRRFEADLIGTWRGNKGELKEWFRFDDGEKSTRVWQLEKTADNRYRGTAGDVIGVAQGETAGSALYWRYQLEIQYQGKPLEVTLDDWMYLVNEKRLFNRTEIIKWGFKVGEVILIIEKHDT